MARTTICSGSRLLFYQQSDVSPSGPIVIVYPPCLNVTSTAFGQLDRSRSYAGAARPRSPWLSASAQADSELRDGYGHKARFPMSAVTTTRDGPLGLLGFSAPPRTISVQQAPKPAFYGHARSMERQVGRIVLKIGCYYMVGIWRAALALLRFAASLLAANRSRLVVLVAGSTAVALAASSIAIASVVSFATVRQTVAAGWRGPYDILVRPADAPTLSLDELRVVPINYLGSRTSGITRDDWQRILAIPGVEVAAPVASLGWIKPDDATVEVALRQPAADEILRIDIETTLTGQRLVSTAFVAIDPATGFPSLFAGGNDTAVGGGSLQVTVGLLPSAWGLVVGIDPIEENKLVGLESYVIDSYLDRGVGHVQDEAFGAPAVAVPVITAGGQALPGTASVTVHRLTGVDPVAIAEAIAQRNADALKENRSFLTADEMLALIEQQTAGARAEALVSVSRPLSELVEPLRSSSVRVDEAGNFDRTGEGGFGAAFGRNAVLIPEPAPYQVMDGQGLRLQAKGSWSEDVAPAIAAIQPPNFVDLGTDLGGTLKIDDPIFRPLRVEQPPLFVLQAIGTYDLQRLSALYNTVVNYAPLGIYADAPRRLIETPDGRAVDELLPTSLNPGGLNPLPPVGLTNLEAVEALRGAHFIDAVRVRVAGIAGYSPAAVQKIEDVAAAISARTGLDVVVVAGSSPVDLQVQVPGLGTIAERWTTLGEAPRIESAVGGFSGILLWAAALVVGLYLLTFGLFLVGDQAAELGVLRLIGWRRRDAAALLVSQAAVLGIVAGVVGCLLTLLVAKAMTLEVSPAALAAVGIGSVLAHLAAAGVVGAWVLRRRASDSLRGTPTHAISYLHPRGTLSLAVANALDSRIRMIGLTVALALAVTLAVFVIGLQVGLQGRLRTTLLGQLVAVRVGPYHVLAAAGAMFAAGAMATDSAVLAVERRLALLGLLRAVGWRARELHRLIRFEVGVPATLGGVLAAGATVVSLAAFDVPPLAVILLAIIALLVALGVGILASQPAAELATRVSPGVALRAEGASAMVPGFTGRAALISVGTFATLAVAASIAWGVIQPPGIPPGAVVPAITPVPPSQSEARVREDIATIAAQPDRRVGTEALSAAQAFVRRRLEEAGYRVSELRFLARTPMLMDRQGSRIDPEQELSSLFAVSLAYDLAIPESGEVSFRDLTYVDATSGAPPGDACPRGLVVLRIGRSVIEYGGAAAAPEFEDRCRGQTAAVLAITAPDGDWQQAPSILGEIRFPVCAHLIAEPMQQPAGNRTPWLVAALDSVGPGATLSAAPSAVALEVGRLAAQHSVAVRLAFVVEQDGAAASVLVRHLAALTPDAPVLTLGPMGGPLATTLGSTDIPAQLDPAAITAGLLATVRADAEAAAWVTLAEQQSRLPTSAEWLTALASKTGLTPTGTVGLNVFALSAGINAAILGQDPTPVGAVQSIAGTPTDTVEQVDVAAMAALAERIAAALTGAAP